MTVDDLELLPEDGNRYEILDGELCVAPAAGWKHQRIRDRVTSRISAADPDEVHGQSASDVQLTLGTHDAVIPDLVWIAAKRIEGAISAAGRVVAPPDIVLEVLSPGAEARRRDMERKREAYDRFGVREYWVADPALKTVVVFRRAGDGPLAFAQLLAEDDVLESPQLPGFAAPLPEIFR
jgi:Uma2 family endonuclease